MATQKPSQKSSPKPKAKKDKDTKKKKPVAPAKGKAAAGAEQAPPNGQDAAAQAKEKLKKVGRGVTEASADDVDPEEQAEELAAAVEVDPDAVEEEVEEEAIVERKEVKDLLEAGRQKGFLTYDEVNDALPADIVSSDQI